MQFGKKLIPEIGNNIVKGLISIGLASAGYGAWALVYGQLSGLAISNILLWIVVPWMPRLTLIAKTAGQLFNYGISIMADKALTIFGDSFDYFLIGRLFTSTTLGIYTLAYKLPELLVITTLNVLGGVFFPAFSTIQHQPEELRKSFLAATKYVQLLVTPICLGLIVAADPIIRLVFGLQWLEAIPLMQILSAYTLVLSIGYHVGDVYKAIGRPDILIKLSIPILVIRIIALWIGSHHGLIGVAVGHLEATCLEVVIRTIVTIRVIYISLLDFTRQLTAFIGGGVLLALTIPTFYATSTLQPTIQLISIGFIGAIGYTISIWFVEKDSLIKIFQLLGLVPKKISHPVQG
jgi:PST family polysaccharide transporter